VARVQNPSKGFCEVVSRIEDARNVFQDDFASLFPVLDGKELDVNVAGTFSGVSGIDKLDCGGIVFMKDDGLFLWEAKLLEDGSEIKSNFGSGHCSKEFSFSGAGGSDGLSFASVGNSGAGNGEDITSGGASVAKVIGMSSINIASESEKGCRRRKLGEVLWEVDFGQRQVVR